ncbi:MAG: hypothetical protein JSS74_17035 [Actinobacteria bacterium]|nr:hypothetical protein [Actinomycetota bacterium]
MADPVKQRTAAGRRAPGVVVAAVVLLLIGALGFAALGVFYLVSGIIDLSAGVSDTIIAFTVTLIGAGLCALATGLAVPASGLLHGRLRARAGASTCAVIGVVIALVAAVLALGAGNLMPVLLFLQVAVLAVGLALLRSAPATRHFTR